MKILSLHNNLLKLLLPLLLFSFVSHSANKITMGAILFPPHTTFDEKTKQCIGKNISVSKKILSEYGLDIDVVCGPPDRIYQLIKTGVVDFTVNIKNTKSLAQNTVFIETPFRSLSLNMYSFKDIEPPNDIVVVRGFSYQGYTEKLIAQGYELVEMPTNTSATRVFIEKNSCKLLSYDSPFKSYMLSRNLDINQSIIIEPLLQVTSHYAISATSKNLKRLQTAFNGYAKKYNVQYFDAL